MVKVNAPLPPIGRLFPPLFRSTRPEPVSPLTVPPTVKLLVAQEMLMLVTFALPTVPEPFETVHAWLVLVGCVNTLTTYAAPLASCVLKVNAVALGFTGRFSLAFRRSMSPDPVRPAIAPPIV